MGLFRKKQNKEENNFDNFPPIGGLMVSKMVVDNNIKPGFMYREKRIRPEDSGWRIFTGLESQEYADNPDNTGIYNPSTILKIDPSIQYLLLKGIGSVYERAKDDTEWYKVTDFDLEDDYITIDKLTEKWTIEINNLFERTIEEDGTLYYTTGDKSIRLNIWNTSKNKEELYQEHTHYIKSRNQTISKTLETFDFSDHNVSRLGYLIEENEAQKVYNVLFGFSIINRQVLQIALYFDEKEDYNWAINTWKSAKSNY